MAGISGSQRDVANGGRDGRAPQSFQRDLSRRNGVKTDDPDGNGKSRQTPATALDMQQKTEVAACRVEAWRRRKHLQLLPDFVADMPARPLLLFTGLSLTERPAPMPFIGGEGVGVCGRKLGCFKIQCVALNPNVHATNLLMTYSLLPKNRLVSAILFSLLFPASGIAEAVQFTRDFAALEGHVKPIGNLPDRSNADVRLMAGE
jgi:hypothetical protein